MVSRLRTRHLTLGLVIGVLLTFQNCGQPEQTADESSFQDNLPLAYNAQIDTMAYMSCSSNSNPIANKRAYFTFRAGSYDPAKGGLALNPAFKTATQYYTPEDRAVLMATSTRTANSRLNLSIRMTSDYQSLWGYEEVGLGEELDSFLPPLNSLSITRPVAAIKSTTGKVNYFPGNSTQRLMEASLRFFQNESIADQTRRYLDTKTATLVMGYSASTAELDTKLRGPDSTALFESVYGTGFTAHFSSPYNKPNMTLARTLRWNAAGSAGNAGIEEIDLITNTAKPSTWDCRDRFSFMIIRQVDWVPFNSDGVTCLSPGRCCYTGPDVYRNTQEQEALAAIRRVLRVEDWWVDVANRCVVSKSRGDECYGNLGEIKTTYGTACVTSTPQLCPHFVSVCIRQ